MKFTALSTTLLLSSFNIQDAIAWGVAGHEIIATIAQIHLFPSTKSVIKEILPDWTGGHLAPIAAWADRIRVYEKWSGPLHYISPLEDYPPDTCNFLTWRSEANVITAIGNYTHRILNRFSDPSADLDLRFLVHFLGDVHQPLHLMERERGGNGDPVLFEGRHMSLHGLWDTALITKSIRELNNYTKPLPSRQIEDSLRGTIYDPYVRFIVWEGIRQWWKPDLLHWLDCPSSAVAGDNTDEWGVWKTLKEMNQWTFSRHVSRLPIKMSKLEAEEYSPCTLSWATPIHNLTCHYVFPPHYDPRQYPLRELNTAAYWGNIKNDKLIERLLAMAGLRLASVLNIMLASPEDLSGTNLETSNLETRNVETSNVETLRQTIRWDDTLSIS